MTSGVVKKFDLEKSNFFTITKPLKDRLTLAMKHAEENGQLNDVLWPHQEFALTLGELFESAGMKPKKSGFSQNQ